MTELTASRAERMVRRGRRHQPRPDQLQLPPAGRRHPRVWSVLRARGTEVRGGAIGWMAQRLAGQRRDGGPGKGRGGMEGLAKAEGG